MHIISINVALVVIALVLVLAVDAVPPANDVCENATRLSLDHQRTVDDNAGNVVIQGSTTEALMDGLNFCGENFVNSAGVWYQFDPPETDIVAHVSTCTAATTFDTALTLYQAQGNGDSDQECAALTCLDGRDDDNECDAGTQRHSTISWQAVAGTPYYVLVHGSEANHTGEFGLRVTTSEPLPEDGTSSAEATGSSRNDPGNYTRWMTALIAIIVMTMM